MEEREAPATLSVVSPFFFRQSIPPLAAASHGHLEGRARGDRAIAGLLLPLYLPSRISHGHHEPSSLSILLFSSLSLSLSPLLCSGSSCSAFGCRIVVAKLIKAKVRSLVSSLVLPLLD
ncbi:hypothetical protein COCNU_12G002690 [Cocos nucifera]|uniref:Uncharacterized protein n=1 Tax=Cocos nucifera TaxID=13894 RepID=A0A8K0N9U0_COCNU|nr:hypothetical protein COCNU_12G002690 [Cocos nucifera]